MGDENVLKFDCGEVCITMNIVKTTELKTLNTELYTM